MQEIITTVVSFLKNVIELSNPMIGAAIGFFVITIESIFPFFLPLACFIALNMLVFGSKVGILITYLGCIAGSMISFYLFRKGFNNLFHRKIIKDRHKIEKWMTKASNLSLTTMTIIIAMPFAPAFLINVIAGLSDIPPKKFLTAILIGKIFIVYFWGFIGTSAIASITDINVLLKLGIMMLLAFLISKMIIKKVNIE